VLDCVRTNRDVELQGGQQTRDPLYITDAVEAFIRAGLMPDAAGRAFPIGGGREWSVTEMSRAALAAVGADLPVRTEARPPRENEIWRCYADNTEAASALGWAPSVSFEDGLARMFQLAASSASGVDR